MKLSSSALHQTTVGHLVNILSTDVAKFDTVSRDYRRSMGQLSICRASSSFTTCGSAPSSCSPMHSSSGRWDYRLVEREITVDGPGTVIKSIISIQFIGVSCLAGFAVIIVLLPLQAFFGRLMGTFRLVQLDKLVEHWSPDDIQQNPNCKNVRFRWISNVFHERKIILKKCAHTSACQLIMGDCETGLSREGTALVSDRLCNLFFLKTYVVRPVWAIMQITVKD